MVPVRPPRLAKKTRKIHVIFIPSEKIRRGRKKGEIGLQYARPKRISRAVFAESVSIYCFKMIQLPAPAIPGAWPPYAPFAQTRS